MRIVRPLARGVGERLLAQAEVQDREVEELLHVGAVSGGELVLAGFDWLSRHGLHHGILYVEATNAGAIALYEKLGLERNAVDRWWTIDLTEPAP